MDALAGLLDGPRAHQAFVLRASLAPPWCLRIEDEEPLALIAIVRGGASLARDGGGRTDLGEGDVAIVLGPQHYELADSRGTSPQAVIHPGQICTTPDGRELEQMRSFGVRTWGNAREGETIMLVGTYALQSEVSGRLLRALPDFLVLRAAEWESPVIPLMAAEVVKDEPGQAAVLDRLLDLMLITVLRAWFARSQVEAPGWYRAHSDPVIGKALQLLQDEPAQQWTVAALARETGVSRATLARRFRELVGEPPMAFLTGWRMALAADLLREPGATVGSVAQRVGYATPFALSTAFKRELGVSPQQYRRSR